ncbi:MAG TPA: DUF3160 domain-containing protein [Verrucomicrobiae bacterium]|nr:DUF3160 domain-containing protein [Verrucomicrobiae bacterium]
MKNSGNLPALLLSVFFAFCQSVPAEDQIQLQLKKSAAQGEIGLHSQMALPVSALYPEYVIQQSSNLVNWTTAAGPFSGSVGVSDEFLRVAVPTAGSQSFYRVVANVKVSSGGSGIGDAIYGYGTAFGRQLQQLGQLSLADFVLTYQLTNQYLPQITFNPTTADFWNLFNTDPAVWNATNSFQNWRVFDFRLNPAELAVFQTNGFVVSQRLERRSFADVYYDLYTDDLPVFVTADSVLQAWHRSFVTMVAEIEETCFQQTLSNLVVSMSAQVPTLWAQASGTAMANGVLDADYFLAVARSLVSGVNNYGLLGQTARVNTALIAINNLQPVSFNLYGENRTIDFSQFTVRGHYANSTTLQRYFRAMIWCGLADFRYAGFSTGAAPGGTNAVRELSGAVALELLQRNSGSFSNWFQFNRTLEMLVGTPDSLTFAQLNGLLVAAGINSPADLPNQAALTNLQNQLMSGQLGMQQITSGYYYSPFSAVQVKLPRSFCFMGQRFVMDSWAFSKTTFDSIIWDENGIPELTDKVLRRVPSALDVAFAVLGNSQIVPEIAARIARTNLTLADGRAYWRDGRQYQHNLAAVRNVIDSQNPAAWTNTVYNHWLACLRLLSEPTTGDQYPEAMRTRAWAMKTVNTQLASWTHLRYTTALYVKESYTPIVLCLYPKGYAEPRPAFWSRIGEMALATKAVLTLLPTNGVFNYTHYTNDAFGDPSPYTVSVSGATMYANRLALIDRYTNTMDTLRAISEKELSKTPFSAADNLFFQHLVEFNYVGKRTYTGWYPNLFYQPGSEYVPYNSQTGNGDSGDEKGSDFWDPLVTTVHTDSPDPLVGDPGSILHEAVGNVQFMLIAVDNGPGDLAVYGAPVLSHYEFELGPTTRLTDAEWKGQVTNNIIPAAPDWTKAYLVPK